jgi:hypothetical protein
MAVKTLAEQLADDLTYSIFASENPWTKTVTYKSGGTGAGISIKGNPAGVKFLSTNLEPYIRGEQTSETYMWFKKVDVTNPAYGDTFTFDGVTWVFGIQGVQKSDGYSVFIHLERIMEQ